MRPYLLAAMLLLALPASAQTPLTGATPPTTSAPPLAGTSALPSTPAQPTRGRGHSRGTQAERFEKANVTHDGKLTLDQAKAAHMNAVVRDFASIDKDSKGYVTMADIRDHRRAVRAAHKAAKG